MLRADGGRETATSSSTLPMDNLWGNPKHLASLATALRKGYSEDRLHILVAARNADSYTYDGIELGGERITYEIEEKLEELEKEGKKIKKLSIVGYSLGGLVARYAIGLLENRGVFDRVEPVNFTTFATPHLGVRTPLRGPHSYLWNVLGARTLSTSGGQLFTIDSFRDTDRPLLAVLAEPTSIFIRALRKFKHRSLYANIVNDRSAVYYTTAISATDPFVDLDAVELHPLEGYGGVILDPDNPATPKPPQALTLPQRLLSFSRATLSNLPLIAFLTLFIPIGSVLFLINSGVQTYRSRQRVRLHEQGKAGIGVGMYRFPLMIQEATRMYERMGGQQTEEYLPTPPPEESEDDLDNVETPASASASASAQISRAPSPSAESKERLLAGGGDKAAERRVGDRGGEFPLLALTEEQFAMVRNLDAVGWRKYPVHIKKVGHTHAAIVVRMDRKSFEEGRVVIGHWVETFEV
ncbi:hypothetical protein LTR50_000373 [Elasticomyces elasticus]|nr:hypothetical protein LTR50_000373 [Elasticomyces elasticus]